MESIKCRAEKHGDQSLELNLSYPVKTDKPQRRNHYSMTAWIFTPSQLNIEHNRYPEKDFLRDLLSYTRFGTMRMTLAEINDLTNSKSPLARIAACFRTAREEGKPDERRIIYETRNFTNYLISGLINETRKLKQLARTPSINPGQIQKPAEKLLQHIRDYRESREQLKQLFDQNNHNSTLNKTLSRSFESISIKMEKGLWRICSCADQFDLPDLKRAAEVELEEEIRLCRIAGIRLNSSIDSPESASESLIHEQRLKKWSQQILYMTVTRTANAKRLTALFVNLAATVAVSTAFIISFIISDRVQEQSLIGISAAVVIYVLRDRLKETFRDLLLRILPILVSDRESKLIDPYSGKKRGITRERASYTPLHSLSEGVRELRNLEETDLEQSLRQETILQYHKEVRIESRKLILNHPRLYSLREILRLDMKQWFRKMDKAEESLFRLTPDGLKQVMARRVYHINLIVRLEVGGNQKSAILHRYRITANRKKILQIAKIGQSKSD